MTVAPERRAAALRLPATLLLLLLASSANKQVCGLNAVRQQPLLPRSCPRCCTEVHGMKKKSEWGIVARRLALLRLYSPQFCKLASIARRAARFVLNEALLLTKLISL
jgi:hypothetical protein